GSYTLGFKAAQRACCVAPNVQPVKVMVDGSQVGALISPASTSFTSYSVSFSIAASGVHTIGLAGTDPADKTTFIGAVTLTGGGGLTATTTTLTSSLNPSTVGASVTLTATVSGSTPTGAVAFNDGGSAIAGCAAVALSGGGGSSPTASCTTSALTAA